jgi:hypothetical protein
MTNTLAYYYRKVITAVKCFIVQSSDVNVDFFTTSLTERPNKLDPFQSSVMSEGKARSLPRGERLKVLHSGRLRSYSNMLD